MFLFARGEDHVRFLRIGVHRMIRCAFVEVLPSLINLFL